MLTQKDDNMRRILWVEDEQKSFRAFSFAIKDSFDIVRAEDYNDALEKLEENRFDLFIVDIIIPGGGIATTLEELLNKQKEKFFGLKFITHLRKNGFSQPIVALTVVREQNFIDSIARIDKSIQIIWKYDADGDSLLKTIEAIFTTN